MHSAMDVWIISLIPTCHSSEKLRNTITEANIARHANNMRDNGFINARLFMRSKRTIIHWKGKTKANADAEKYNAMISMLHF